MVLAAVVIGGVFSPYPGAKAVTVGITPANLSDTNNSMDLALTVDNPTLKAGGFPGGITSETIPNGTASTIHVFVDKGTANQKDAIFNVNGKLVTDNSAGAILGLTFVGIKDASNNPTTIGYGNFYGYGYGTFSGLPGTYGTIGNGSGVYGITSNGHVGGATASYKIKIAPSLLSSGSHTIQTQVAFPTTTNTFDSSIQTFSNTVTTDDYLNSLFGVYDSRSDLQGAFPNAHTSHSSLVKLIDWGAFFGVKENPGTLGKYAAKYHLVSIAERRPDVIAVFGDPTSSTTSFNSVVGWANGFGVNEHANELHRYTYVYALQTLWLQRGDLQTVYPGASHMEKMGGLFGWAASHAGQPFTDSTGPYVAQYKLLSLHDRRGDLKTSFPEAENGGDIKALLAWAINFGTSQQPGELDTKANYQAIDGSY